MTADTDTATIRRELRDAGVEGIPDRGKLSAEHMDAWRRLREDTGTGFDTEPDEPADGPETPEDRPRPPRAARGPRGGLFTRRQPRDRKRKTRSGRGGRISVATLIEDGWYQFAEIFEGVPPLFRCLTMEAPFAGMLMEDAVKGTVIDLVLQPLARNEQRMNTIGGLVGLPLATAAAVQNAPAPGEEPGGRFKAAVYSMRLSARLLARAGVGKAEELAEHAEQVKARAREADRLVAWILTGEVPPEDAPGPAAAAQEDEAIARARALFGQ